MHDMTAMHLRSAYGGESMAHMRYKIWGDRAGKDGFPNVARLFLASSHSEHIHAWNHFLQLRNEPGAGLVTSGAGFGLGSTAENLQAAVNGERFEIEEMYPVYQAAAELQAEDGAARSFLFAIAAEKVHADLFTSANEAVSGGLDLDIDEIHVCDMCGFMVEGAAPDTCPMCGASKDKFIQF